MRKNNISEAIGIFISLGGVVVMTGWFLNIEALKSILPMWVSMKFSTALSFFLSGAILFFIARFQKKDREWAVIIIPIASLIILLLMTSLFASTILGADVGVEQMFIKDSMTAIGSVTPGRPAIPTMLNFILIAIAGILTIVNLDNRWNRLFVILGAIVAVTGLTAIAGYSLDQPLFYFKIAGRSSAMALHTAILFVLWGSGIILVRKK